MSVETSLAELATNPATSTEVENDQNSGVDETEVENTDSTEAHEDAEGNTNSEDSEDESEVKPKKSGFEKRISKEVARKNAALQEVAYWKKVALEKGVANEKPQAETKVETKPKFADYNDIEAYTDAMTDWKMEKKLQEVQQTSKANTVVKNYNDRIAEFEKTRPDFKEVLAESELTVSDAAKELIFDSEVGPAIVLYLAENEDEAHRINGMSAVRQLAELGKLETKLTPKVKEKKVTSNAPAPIKPVQGGAPITTKSLDDPTMPTDEWIKMRNKQTKFR